MTFHLIGIALGIVGLSFVSEDAALISSLGLAQTKVIPLSLAIIVSAVGIYLGDWGLYLIGKWGKDSPFVKKRWGKALKKWQGVEMKTVSLQGLGAVTIFGARFVPGTRLPVYLGAGVLGMSPLRFGVLTAIAVATWIGIAVTLSTSFLSSLSFRLAILVFGSLIVIVVAAPIFFRSRYGRSFFYRQLRWRYFEFWPMWAFYTPVVVYYFFLVIRYRSFKLPAFANPGIPNGGLIGESKSLILSTLPKNTPERLAFAKIEVSYENREKWISHVQKFVERESIAFPFILKPDVGQRGSGVRLVLGEEELSQYFEREAFSVLAQQYCPYPEEVGVNYVRFPGNPQGHIIGITRKRFPFVTGDGETSLADLILADRRARYIAAVYFRRHKKLLNTVLPQGKQFRLVESGNHCQGTIFEDGIRLRTPALEARIDAIAKLIPGFFVGRFDLRFRSEEELCEGEGFKIIEVNGAAGEATHIYDSHFKLFDAYAVLFEQLRVLFAVGKENRQHQLAVETNIIEEFFNYRKLSRNHPITT